MRTSSALILRSTSCCYGTCNLCYCYCYYCLLCNAVITIVVVVVVVAGHILCMRGIWKLIKWCPAALGGGNGGVGNCSRANTPSKDCRLPTAGGCLLLLSIGVRVCALLWRSAVSFICHFTRYLRWSHPVPALCTTHLTSPVHRTHFPFSFFISPLFALLCIALLTNTHSSAE